MGLPPWRGSPSAWGWTGFQKATETLSGSPTPPNTPKVSPHQCKSPFIDTELPQQSLHWPELLLTPTTRGFYGMLAAGEAKPTRRGLPRHYLGTARRC